MTALSVSYAWHGERQRSLAELRADIEAVRQAKLTEIGHLIGLRVGAACEDKSALSAGIDTAFREHDALLRRVAIIDAEIATRELRP